MGDYTLSLAAGLRSLGHSLLVIGLNDKWIENGAATAGGENASGVLVERLASSLPYAERVDRACARMRDFRADWASFQMSCYAYHRKGLLFGLNRHLRRLSDTCENWQMMFQELWSAFHIGAPMRKRLVGVLQRYAILGGVRAMRPRLLQTSTPLFRAMLKSVGIEASILPLPGSIPVNPDPGTEWFLGLLGENGIPLVAEKRKEHLVGGFFGAVDANWDPAPFFATLRKVAQRTGQKVTICAAGRMGAGGASWDRRVPEYPDFRFLKLGELSFERVSQYLRNLDFGIAATPWQVIGKSSATAAMLDHGVPVMVTRSDSQPRARLVIDPPASPLLFLADRDVSDLFLAGLPHREPRHTAQDLAEDFVRRMEAAQSAPRFGG